ncbi:MAG: pyruvate formate lyase family protein [Candidatus Helarchaeota archaeon]
MSKADAFTGHSKEGQKFKIAQPHGLSSRSKWLRDYYFKGLEREWNNEYMPFSTGNSWDRMWYEGDYYIVPEVYPFMGIKSRGIFGTSIDLMAIPVKTLDPNFWNKSLPERRMLFFKEVLLNYIPQEIIGDADLIAGGRFNTQLSKCLNEKEEKIFNKKILKVRNEVFKYHQSGFGNVGATGGHLIADYETIVKKGFKYIYEKIKNKFESLSPNEKNGPKGNELKAMLIAAEIPRKLAMKYAEECKNLIKKTNNPERKKELEQMVQNLEIVPWEPAKTFWQGVQSIWLTHMLIIAEESYPGPGVSFGRFDQYLWDLYKKDVIDEKNITKEFAKDILGSFWFHCNTVYDAQMRVGGNQGITSGFGQLMTLSGMGPNGVDLTNELTYTILEVIDEWSPILEPKPNVRLHKNSPDKLLEKIIDMITNSQGAPFILNFDEKSMAGLILEGIPEDEVWNYACVGCLENTMQGNDRSGTVNCNPNLAKSIELTLWSGKNKFIKGEPVKKPKQIGTKTGEPEKFKSWEEFWEAWVEQIKFIIKHTVDVYNLSEKLRAEFLPTPYLSTLVRGCIEKGIDIRAGGPEIKFVTIEGVAFATTVDSLLAIKKFVYDEKKYTISQIKEAIINNFSGKKEYEIMQSVLANKAPKYGNNNDEADELARKVMEIWSMEALKYKTPTDFQFRGGMLSWNYWAGEDAAFTPATPNGRYSKTFLSNAICPTNGADINGPTAVANSIGIALGGKAEDESPINYLPNGASHTITFNPSILRDPEHRDKFKAFLRGYIENGGTALQINMIDSEMLKEAQAHPENYKNLLVRVTGYNAYFVAIGKELQDEIIARESHQM